MHKRSIPIQEVKLKDIPGYMYQDVYEAFCIEFPNLVKANRWAGDICNLYIFFLHGWLSGWETGYDDGYG